MTVRPFSWAHGSGEVQALGGMLGPVRFRLADGREVSPLHVAPWADEAGTGDLPGILRRLRGEWPCVPFGIARPLPLSGDWAPWAADPTDGLPPHGHGSNADWTFGEGLSLSIDYPAGSPIARLDRAILPDPDAPALDIRLTVHPRRDVLWPIGLHPTFRVPPSGLRIETASGGMVFPAEVEPGVSRLAPAATFDSLARVPLAAGGTADLTRLPLPFDTEELVQLTAPDGRLRLLWPDERFGVEMTWNPADFPGLVLWISNRGRSAAPWSGRHVALGAEPVCAPFDLGPRIAAATNPLAAAGHPTARAFRAGEPFTTTLRLAAVPL